MTLFDSHAHYWDEKLKDDAATLVPAFLASGGVGIVNVGTSPETSRLAAEQARVSQLPREQLKVYSYEELTVGVSGAGDG